MWTDNYPRRSAAEDQALKDRTENQESKNLYPCSEFQVLLRKSRPSNDQHYITDSKFKHDLFNSQTNLFDYPSPFT